MSLFRWIPRDARAISVDGLINGVYIGIAALGLIAVANGLHRMHDLGIWHF